jgi:hypothetical protein
MLWDCILTALALGAVIVFGEWPSGSRVIDVLQMPLWQLLFLIWIPVRWYSRIKERDLIAAERRRERLVEAREERERQRQERGY